MDICTIRPGMKGDEIRNYQIESADDIRGGFIAQEYLYHMLQKSPTAVEELVALPDGLKEKQYNLIWEYEHLRAIVDQLTQLVVKLDCLCTPDSCPEMRVGDDWVFLCAAHKAPQQCPAIDYIVHTLDATITVLNNRGMFPSRITVNAKGQKVFSSIYRRLARVFAHVYVHHREVFDDYEDETALCERFLVFGLEHKFINIKSSMLPENFLDERKAARLANLEL